MIGQVELVLGAFAHELQALGPAFDHLIEAEFDGLSPLVGAVEHLAVGEGSLVVAVYLIGGLGLLAGAFLDNLVHKTASSGLHLRILGHLGQEFLTFGLGGGAGCGGPLGSFLFQFLIEGFQGFAGFLHREFQLTAGKHILETFQKIVYVSHVDSLLIEAGSHAHSKCITFLIHIYYNDFAADSPAK